MEVIDDTLAVDVTARVGRGGNFLPEDHTLEHMRNEHSVPQVADRQPREMWDKDGVKDTWARCNETALAILRDHKPVPVDDPKAVRGLRAVDSNGAGQRGIWAAGRQIAGRNPSCQRPQDENQPGRRPRSHRAAAR